MCLDEDGKLYRVPNFCINDPTFKLELLNKLLNPELEEGASAKKI